MVMFAACEFVQRVDVSQRTRHDDVGVRSLTRYSNAVILENAGHFAQGVGPAHLGAVTHPGMKGERHVYADL